MRNFITNKISKLFSGMIGFLIAVPLLIAGGVYAATIYPAGSLLQPNDVTSSHIRDNTIMNADVNSAAAIVYSKLTAPGSDNNVTFNTAGVPSADPAFRWYTSGRTLMLSAGTIAATSTNFNGVAYTWPSADGTANQVIQTDGAGTLSFVSPASTKTTATIATDELLVAGTPVAIATSTVTAEVLDPLITPITGPTSFGNTTARSKVAQSLTPTASTVVSGVRFNAGKTGAPTDNYIISLQTDSAGAPSGTYIASTTIAMADLSTTLTGKDVFMATTTLTANTKYWVVFDRSGGLDAVNYPMIGYNNTNPYAAGNWSSVVSGTWTNDTSLEVPLVLLSYNTKGNLLRTSATALQRTGSFVGISNGTYGPGQTATIVVGGTMTGLSGLTTGSDYYLGNATGTLSVTVGTNEKKVCTALSATTCILKNSW